MGDFAEARRRLISKIEGCEDTHQYMLNEHLVKRGVNPDNYYRLNVEERVESIGRHQHQYEEVLGQERGAKDQHGGSRENGQDRKGAKTAHVIQHSRKPFRRIRATSTRRATTIKSSRL